MLHIALKSVYAASLKASLAAKMPKAAGRFIGLVQRQRDCYLLASSSKELLTPFCWSMDKYCGCPKDCSPNDMIGGQVLAIYTIAELTPPSEGWLDLFVSPFPILTIQIARICRTA